MTDWTTKYVVITGVASGIGQAQAELLLAKGAHVIGIDQQMVQNDFREKQKFLFFQGDVSDRQFVEQVASACAEKALPITTLLNTAGILDDYRPLLETTSAEWQRTLAVNLESMFHLCQVFLPGMLERQAGVILNMASIAGQLAGGGGIAYTTSKHAIVGFTRQLAYDYADKGIRVNALAPGAIATPMNAADFAGDGAMAAWVASETPVKRWAEAAEVAEASLFLISDEAAYLQGVVLPIDGGWSIK